MKKYFIGLAILAVAFSAFAFRNSNVTESKPAVTNSWYEYVGPVPQTPSSIKDENNYVQVTAPSGCNSDRNICAILVPGTSEHPDAFNSTLEEDLENSFLNREPQSGYIEMKQ